MNASPAPAVPADRTIKQPIAWQCGNPQCMENGKRFIFTNDYGECPKCTLKPPATKLLALVHLVYPDKNGPLPGKTGNWALACDPKRAYSATETNREAATNRTAIVNCPGCIKWLTDNGLSQLQDTLLLQRKGT
jgi:hypothetical protein